jgi:NAD/NADP transhydrogenase beta subunit
VNDALSEAAAATAGLSLNNVLAIAAAALLVFVSGGVIYLSTVEWRDRRRRQQPVSSRR